MSAPTHVRFPGALDAALSAYARRTGAKKSTVVVGALREWLSMQAHPGVVFVSTVTGQRQAALATGPPVWTVAEAWQQHAHEERDPAVVARTLGLTVRDVETALAYWADQRAEIDDLIARHHAAQDEALLAWERRRSLNGV